MQAAQIGLADVVALAEDAGAIGDPQRHARVLLHEKDGEAAPDGGHLPLTAAQRAGFLLLISTPMCARSEAVALAQVIGCAPNRDLAHLDGVCRSEMHWAMRAFCSTSGQLAERRLSPSVDTRGPGGHLAASA